MINTRRTAIAVPDTIEISVREHTSYDNSAVIETVRKVGEDVGGGFDYIRIPAEVLDDVIETLIKIRDRK